MDKMVTIDSNKLILSFGAASAKDHEQNLHTYIVKTPNQYMN